MTVYIPNDVWIVFSFLGFIACIIPLPWHLEAWNTGTCLYMIWAALANLNQFVNNTMWNHDAINRAPVFCDISAKFIVGTAVGIPAASLCINRRLYQIASVRSVTVTKAEKRRGVIVDLAIGLGIPLLYMALHYINQGHRFNIFEEVGCSPATYNTPVAIVLVSLPPVLIGCVSAVYSTLTIRAFMKSRRQFKELLSGSANPNLNSGRYLRLMMLAGIEALLTVPLGLFAIYENCVVGEVYPWVSWDNTHSNFSRVVQIPALIWRMEPDAVLNIQMNKFFVVLCACVFFGFFGFAEEARKHYRSGVESVAKRMGVSTSGTLFSSTRSKSKGTLTSSTAGTVPVFVERSVVRKRDSLDSFSDMSVSINESFDEKKEKTLTHALSYDDIKLPDVGGTLADFKDDTISPTPSSGSSASSLSDVAGAVTRPDSSIIEISSVRSLEAAASSDLALPAPYHSPSSRYLSDSSAV